MAGSGACALDRSLLIGKSGITVAPLSISATISPVGNVPLDMNIHWDGVGKIVSLS